MVKKTFRWSAWLLLLAMLFSAVSCSFFKDEPEPTGTESTTTTVAGENPPVNDTPLMIVDADGASAYTIVRCRAKTDGSNQRLMNTAGETQYIIEHMLGTKLDIKADTSTASDYEIVIGQTAREGKAFDFDRSELKDGESLIRVIGNRILLTGTDDVSTERAVYEFLFRYVVNREGNTISVPKDLNILLPADVKTLPLTIGGVSISEFVIVSPADANPMETYAAQNLQHYIMKTTGVRLEIKSDAEAQTSHEIQVGRTNRVESMNLQTENLGTDGFILTVSNGHLVISGGEKDLRGTLYGVYEFLEAYLGWKFLFDEFEMCDADDAIVISESLRDEQTPDMEYRWYRTAPDDPYQMAKRKQSAMKDDYAELGGAWNYAGVDCHTINMLLGIGGTIFGEQPCYSSESNYQMALKNVRSWLSQHPTAEFISVSMTDNESHCTCDDCERIMEEEGGAPMGVMLRMVNRIANAIKDEYPNVMVETLAYYDFKICPTKTKPADNVVIRVAPIERCYQHSLADTSCSINAQVRDYLEDWFAATDNVLIYEYGCKWPDFLSPFGNIYQLYDDMRYYQSHGIMGMFLLGQYLSPSADFGHLRSYLASELMWNVDMTREEYEEMIWDFLRCFYGEGWESVLKWLDWVEDGIDTIGNCYNCYGEVLFDNRVDQAVFKRDKALLEGYFADAFSKVENYYQFKNLQILNQQYQYMDLCITFKQRYKAGRESKEAVVKQNQQFYNSIQHYNIRLRESVGNPNAVSYSTSPDSWV